MAANPATTADLSARSFRTLTTQELSVGGTLLGDAWAMVLTARPSVGARIDAAPADPVFVPVVKQILCAMVLRVLNNPDGKLEESQDDYRYRLDSAVSTGALYISDAELARLSDGDSVSDGAWSIRPSYGRGHGTWVSGDQWEPL